MASDLVLRDLWPSDWDQVRRLFKGQGRPAPRFQTVFNAAKLTGRVGRVVTLKNDDAIVAALLARIDPPVVTVTHLAVVPEYARPSLKALVTHLTNNFPEFDTELRVANDRSVYEFLATIRDAIAPTKMSAVPGDNGKAADESAAYYRYRITPEDRGPRNPPKVGPGALRGAR